MMNKLLAILVSVFTALNTPVISQEEKNTIMEQAWFNSTDEIRQTLPLEYQAYACGMTAEEFEFLARVIQAESNGTYDWSDFEDKVLIACVILNRVEDSRFNNTISSVLTESGQFSTVSGGWCSCSYSDSSRWSIVIAQRRLANGEIPTNLLYFNCQSYFSGFEPYCYQGGNYFSLG